MSQYPPTPPSQPPPQGSYPPQGPYQPPGTYQPPGPVMPQPFPGGPASQQQQMRPSPPVPREPRRYSYFSAIVLSLFSKELYRDVAQRWRGVGLLYLLLVLLLTWIIVGIKMQVGFVRWVKYESPKLVQQMPPITINKGVVAAQATQPYTITNPENGEPFIIIDTTGEVTEPPSDPPSFLLTRDSLIARRNSMELRTFDLSEVDSFRIDQQRINDWLYGARYWLVPAGVVLMFIFSLIMRVVLQLILAAFALGIGSGPPGRSIDYAAGMRLAAVAMTPALLVSTILWLAAVPVGCFGFFAAIAITLAYLFLGVNWSKTPDPASREPWPPIG